MDQASIENGLVRTAKRRSLSLPHCEQHPNKKRFVKNETEMTQASVTNNHGLFFFNAGEYELALNFFRSAMILMSSTRPELCDDCSDRICKKQKVDRAKLEFYQRMDFDEGMDMFQNVETIEEGDSLAVVQAIICYNAGQACRMNEDFSSAWRYYQMAVDSFLVNKDISWAVSNTVMLDALVVERVFVPLLHNAGLVAYRQGKLSDARKYYELAMSRGHAMKKEQDFSVGITYNCLGVISYHLSSLDSSRSLQYFAKALRVFNNTIGLQSAAAATVMNNLGRVFVKKENFPRALGYYDQAMIIRRCLLGIDNLDYAATAFNAGQCLHHLGRHDEAMHLYREFLRVAVAKFSKNHRDIAVVLSSIGQIHQERKEYNEARLLHEASVRVGRTALGNSHAEVAMLLNRLGNFYFEWEKYDLALNAYKEGLAIERTVLSPCHPNIIVTLSNIGEIHRQKSNYDAAVKLYTEAMELQKQRYGKTSAEVASAMNVIGLILDQGGKSDEALNILQEALVMRRSVLGDDHLDVAATLTYLGTIFFRRNMISTAFQLFSESLRIRREQLKTKNRDISFTLYNLGLCYHQQGSYEDAVQCFEEAKDIEIQYLGTWHKDVAITFFKIGESLRAGGDLEGALKNFHQSYQIDYRLFAGKDPATLARTLNTIGNVHLAKGDSTSMMSAFVEAARLYRDAGISVTSVSVSPLAKLYAAEFIMAAAAA